MARLKTARSNVAIMPLNKEKLELAFSTIKKDNEGNYISPSNFVKLSIGMWTNICVGVKYPPIYSFLQYIRQDVGNIEVITSRLAWELDLWNKEQLSLGNWMGYAACDIDLFYIEMRSIFDYVAKVIVRISDKPQEIPDGSFNELRNWLLKKQDNPKTLGEDLANLVRSANWFEELKKVRDTNVHQGGTTLVFLEKDRILFQTSKNYTNLISIPEIMYNENVADFELYAGLYFGYLMSLLEEFSITVRKRLPTGKINFDAGNPRIQFGKEMPTIFLWIQKLIKLIDAKT